MQREFDPGTYNVREGTVTRGKLFVTGTVGTQTVEHWVMYDGWTSPSGTVTTTVAHAGSGNQYGSLSAFLSAMQTEINSQGKSAKYVIATTEWDTIDPV